MYYYQFDRTQFKNDNNITRTAQYVTINKM